MQNNSNPKTWQEILAVLNSFATHNPNMLVKARIAYEYSSDQFNALSTELQEEVLSETYDYYFDNDWVRIGCDELGQLFRALVSKASGDPEFADFEADDFEPSYMDGGF